MGTVLLVESGLACLLAIPLGYLLGKKKGAVALFASVLFPNILFALLCWLSCDVGTFPIHHVALAGSQLPDNYLGITCQILEIAIWAFLLLGTIGYFFSEEQGAFIFVLVTFAVTFIIFLLGLLLGNLGLPDSGKLLSLAVFWLGLLVTILVDLLLKTKKWATLPVLWLSFYIAFAVGFMVAGRLGIYLISWPAVFLFGVTLWYLSQKVLPVAAEQRRDAFRSLLTFALGTNYAYYLIGDWKTLENCEDAKPKPCVAGGALSQLLSGPGIVMTDSNHAVVVSDGFGFRIFPPGIEFTRMFEQIYEVVDLRPQLRTMEIEAETREGIAVKTNVFLPHQIATGGQSVALGGAYPFDENALRLAVCNQVFVDHKWKRDEQRLAIEDVKPIPWDGRILMMAPTCLKEVLIHYACNALHDGYPRDTIATEFLDALRLQLQLMGMELVGGGISNIIPLEKVMEQRIENWKAKSKEKIEIAKGEAERKLLYEVGAIWPKAHLEVLQELEDLLVNADSVTTDALAFQVLECLGATVPERVMGEQLPLESFVRALLQRNHRE